MDGAAVERLIVERIQSDPILASLCGGRVSVGEYPPNAPLPGIEVLEAGNSDIGAIGGQRDMGDRLYSVCALGATDSHAALYAIADRVAYLLENVSGSNAYGSVYGSVRVREVSATGKGPDGPRKLAGAVWRFFARGSA